MYVLLVNHRILPCWERAIFNHLSLHMCCNIFVMVHTILSFPPGVLHYENLPMQYTEIFILTKNENFQEKGFDIFLIFAQNIDCGYTLEPPR